MSIDRSRHRGLMRQPLLLVLGLLALTGQALAGSLNLAWDAVAEASGYRLSYGTTSGAYSASLDAGNQTRATVSGLTEGTRYYFAVQAYDSTRTSAYSDEVNAVVPATAPVASFTANGSSASSLSVTQGQSVTLVDTSSGSVASRSWYLGDGTSATTPTVVKTYASTGTRTVTLSVTGAGVSSSASKTINVTATAVAPVASFTASPLAGTAPLTVRFTDTSSGSISGWSWSFGTGATSTAQSPTYTYSTNGTYSVSLTVSGPGGSNTTTQSGYITVSPPTGGGAVGSAGLVAAYGFDEASGTQVLDASGNGNHGTLSNVTRSTQGRFEGALSFNGTNSLVTVGDNASLDLTSGMTLTAWVYPTTWASGWKNVLIKERTGGLAYALSANSDAGQPNTTLRIGGYDRQLTAGSHLPSNTWTHLAATYDGAAQRLYVNGSQVGSRAQSGSLEVSASPLRIGGNTVWAGQYFQGLIDEVRLYNRALSPTEVAAVSLEPVVAATTPPPAGSVCATPCSLWDNATTPTLAADPDSSPTELGLKFRSEVAGQVTGVRFYKSSQNTGTHVGRLWSSTGQLLAQATFTNESASGWQQVSFATPVTIQANTVYVVSYYAPAGRYAVDEDFFTAPFTKGPLRALSNSEAGGNGVYRYSTGGGFPTSTFRSSNYWVDVVFKTP